MPDSDSNSPAQAEQRATAESANRHNTFFDQIVRFSVKAVILVFLISLGLKWVTPGFREALSEKTGKLARELAKDETRIILTGFFVSNPAVHWKISEFRERQFDYKRAQEEMELALGLFELHRGEPEARLRYIRRLEDLKKAAAQYAAANGSAAEK